MKKKKKKNNINENRDRIKAKKERKDERKHDKIFVFLLDSFSAIHTVHMPYL
jgi:uncharacterized Fe-S cluster-containing protein